MKKFATNIITNAAKAINTKALNIYFSPPNTILFTSPVKNCIPPMRVKITKYLTPTRKNIVLMTTDIVVINTLNGENGFLCSFTTVSEKYPNPPIKSGIDSPVKTNLKTGSIVSNFKNCIITFLLDLGIIYIIYNYK